MESIRQIGAASRGYVLTLAGVGIAALLADRFDELLNTLNISLLYLLVVLISATSYGYGPAILASVASVLSFYFEYYPPYGFNSDIQIEDWLTLAFFLGFAVATARLASSARARAVEAVGRQRELQILHRLTEALRLHDDYAGLLRAIERNVCTILQLEQCELIVGGGDASTGVHGDLVLPLATGQSHVAILRLRCGPDRHALDEEELRALHTFAEQAALAIERAQLAEGARSVAVLREADRLKTSLLRAISHDLRTPLATIKARASSILEGDLDLDAIDWQESIRAIDAEADRLERLVAEVLDLSRIEAGALQLHLEYYMAEEVVGAVVSQLESQTHQHRLLLDVSPELPSIQLDITLIVRVLANLLENACKYSPPGSTIQLSAAYRDKGLLFRVQDEGPGIPDVVRERVFDAFYRVERPLEAATFGVGLGLAICKGMVAAHNGWIRAEEAPGGGASLLVWLPDSPGHLSHGETMPAATELARIAAVPL